MAVHIRLARHGTRKAPYYRVVVADQRSSRNGRFIEHIGLFDPRAKEGPFTLNRDRYDYWRSQGAQPSPTVDRLVKESKPAAS
jgi:small subunit ribosomal protein S16